MRRRLLIRRSPKTFLNRPMNRRPLTARPTRAENRLARGADAFGPVGHDGQPPHPNRFRSIQKPPLTDSPRSSSTFFRPNPTVAKQKDAKRIQESPLALLRTRFPLQNEPKPKPPHTPFRTKRTHETAIRSRSVHAYEYARGTGTIAAARERLGWYNGRRGSSG